MITSLEKKSLSTFLFTPSLFFALSLAVFFALSLILFFPTPVSAQLIYECKGLGLPAGEVKPGDCTFADLIAAIKSILDKVTVFVLEFAVVVIAYAGFRYMRSGDNPGERKAANKMLVSVGIGIFFMLAAWLIVTFIFNALVAGNIPKFLG